MRFIPSINLLNNQYLSEILCLTAARRKLLLMSYRNWAKNAMRYARTFENHLETNDYWALLFISCISLYISYLWLVIPIYLFIKVQRRPALAYRASPGGEIEQVINYIRLDHLESLQIAITANPDLLHASYKKQCLLSWCKFYNNPKAQLIVAELSKKYPKKIAIAA